MKRFITIGLGLGLVAFSSVASAQAQDIPVVATNVSGDCVTSGSPGNWTITCGDLNPGSGITLVGPPLVETAPAPAEVAPAPAPAPVATGEPAPVSTNETATSEPATTEMAVATETDQDADNYADALEAEVGLDPTNVDTDGDHVADGDEFTLYRTDPTIADTDGDGALDGEELFGRYTDPLLWDDGSTASTTEPVASSETAAASEPVVSSEPVADPAPESEAVMQTAAPLPADTSTWDKEARYAASETTAVTPEGTTENLSATSGGAAALGTGEVSAAPGTVTRDGVSGTSLLGPDGTYSVTETAPPIVNVSGDTNPAPVVEPAAIEAE